ncbi:MAG: cupin domain-containing protein, partial [Hydrogeniiclostridium mannosilyticum]
MKVREKEQFEAINMFGTGGPNEAFAQYFTGRSFLNPLTNPQKTALFLANVTFEPGCRNNWHIH